MYSPNRDKVQQIIVDARVNSQQVINTFHLKSSTPIVGGDGNSATLLTAFRTAYRANMLNMMYVPYVVYQYVMTEIKDVIVGGPPANPRSILVFNPDGREVLTGVGADAGQVVGAKYLPTHEVMRVRKNPANLRRGYFESAYNRFTPLAEDDHADASPEQWAAGTITAWQTAFQGMLTASYSDGGGGGANWAMAVFSPEYFIRVIKPAGGGLHKAAELCLTCSASAYVGTQITRRFSPAGIRRGA